MSAVNLLMNLSLGNPIDPTEAQMDELKTELTRLYGTESFEMMEEYDEDEIPSEDDKKRRSAYNAYQSLTAKQFRATPNRFGNIALDASSNRYFGVLYLLGNDARQVNELLVYCQQLASDTEVHRSIKGKPTTRGRGLQQALADYLAWIALKNDSYLEKLTIRVVLGYFQREKDLLAKNRWRARLESAGITFPSKPSQWATVPPDTLYPLIMKLHQIDA